MQVIPRHQLPRLLRAAGLDPITRDFPDACLLHRLTVTECRPLPFTRGPHRKIVYPDGRVEGPIPVADRPLLSRFVAEVFHHAGAHTVLALIPEGAFWLNNRSQATYLRRVPDARRVSAFLRRRGLTDRFRGGFCVRRDQFFDALPLLAANTFAGGADVLFTAPFSRDRRLSLLACHHFDLHLATPDPALYASIAALIGERGLASDTLMLPDLTDADGPWSLID